MKASQFFISTLKEAPADAEVVSHQLMTRAGMIKKLGAGIYSYMPMGLRVIQKVEAIVRDQKRIFPCCAWLQGEYGMKDIYLGVPVKLGKNGIEEIIELQLNADEKELLTNSAGAVKEVMNVLDGIQTTAK